MKKNIKSVCMMLIFVLAVLGLTACGKTELPFNDYVSLEYVGYDGKATASIDFNYSRMMKDFSEQLSNDETSKLAKQLRKIELTSEKLENLSNGDVVDIQWGEIDTEALADMGVIPVYGPLQITVEGLEVLNNLDLFKGIEYSIEGYEGHTRVRITQNPDEYSKYFYSLNIENGEHLKNGDTLIISAECSENDLDIMAYDGYQPESLKYEAKVENLEPINIVNPFEYATPVFWGTAPEGYVYMEWNEGVEEGIKNFGFVYDKSEGLSNGDVIKISVYDEDDDIEYRAMKYGYYPSVTEIEVTVTGLKSNLTSADMISDECLEELKAANIQNLDRDLLYSWTDAAGINKVDYCGTIIATDKEYPENDNNLYLVYRIDVDNEYDGPLQVYWYSKYNYVKSQGDGTLNVISTAERTPRDYFTYSLTEGLAGEAFWGAAGFNYYAGFESLEKLVEAVSEKNVIVENRTEDVAADESPKTEFLARIDYCTEYGRTYDYPALSGAAVITGDGTYTVTLGDKESHTVPEDIAFSRLGVKILGIGESNDTSNIKISNIKVILGNTNQEFTKVKAYKGFPEEYPGNANNMAFYVYYDKDVDGDGNREVNVIETKSYETDITISFKITGITSNAAGDNADGNDTAVIDGGDNGTGEGNDAGDTAGNAGEGNGAGAADNAGEGNGNGTDAADNAGEDNGAGAADNSDENNEVVAENGSGDSKNGTDAGESAVKDSGKKNGKKNDKGDKTDKSGEKTADSEENKVEDDNKETSDNGDATDDVNVKNEADELDKNAKYDVKLTSIGDSKLKAISNIRAITGLGLADSKALAENLPSVLLEDADYEKAVEAKNALEMAGAAVELIQK